MTPTLKLMVGDFQFFQVSLYISQTANKTRANTHSLTLARHMAGVIGLSSAALLYSLSK